MTPSYSVVHAAISILYKKEAVPDQFNYVKFPLQRQASENTGVYIPQTNTRKQAQG